MAKIEPYNHDAAGDPVVSFATDAEIEIADQLRHRLEERYFMPSVPSSSLQPRPGTGRRIDSRNTAGRVAERRLRRQTSG